MVQKTEISVVATQREGNQISGPQKDKKALPQLGRAAQKLAFDILLQNSDPDAATYE